VTDVRTWTLAELNAAPDGDELRSALQACCAAPRWVEGVIAHRPYPELAALLDLSDELTASLPDDELQQALAGHPRIGERAESAWSRQEQSGAADADPALRAELAAANAEYERRFGHVYLVCATGKSAAELLDLCRARLANPPELELDVVRRELAGISRIRLEKLMGAR
jgi:2-oxo-4-hydroxy-4-carboxy-5-ureidoimidazoline decarboxylase